MGSADDHRGRPVPWIFSSESLRRALISRDQFENPFKRICSYEQQNDFYKCDTYDNDQDMVHILYREENDSWVSAHVLPNGQALITSRKYSSSPCPPSGEWLGGSKLKCLNPTVDTCYLMNSGQRTQSCPRNGQCFNTLKSFECDHEPETVLGCDHIQIRYSLNTFARC